MKKVTTLVLMLCFILSGAFCHASGVAGQENKRVEGPILIKQKVQHGGTDKSGSIVPSITGNVLTVVFCENLGQVAVEVSTNAGILVDCLLVLTPNGLQVYLPNAGNYYVTFTLPDGDEYYGEFMVTD